MADKQVGELTAADPLDGSELVHVVQGGNSRQSTTGDIAGIDAGSIYDFGFSFTTTPDAGAIIGVPIPIVKDIVIPADFAGSFGAKGVDGVNPDADWTAEVYDDGVIAFTVTVSSAGAVTFDDGNSPAADVEIAAGSVVTVLASSDSPAEASIANWAFGIAARVA